MCAVCVCAVRVSMCVHVFMCVCCVLCVCVLCVLCVYVCVYMCVYECLYLAWGQGGSRAPGSLPGHRARPACSGSCAESGLT